MADKSVSKRLQNAIIIYSALGILVIGTIVAFVSITPFFNRLKKNADRNLSFAVKTRTLAIEEYLSRAKDLALQVTGRTRIRDYLDAYNSGKISINELVDFTAPKLAGAMNLSKEMAGISRLDHKGELVVQVGLPVPGELWQIPDGESGEALMHGPITLGSESYLIVGAPILDRQSRRIGTDIVLFKAVRLKQIVEDYTGLGETGETVLGAVRDERMQLFFPLRGSNSGAPESFPRNSPLGAAFEKAVHQESGILKSSDGPEVMAYGPVQSSQWGIVVKMNKEELYAPINHQIAITGSIILVLILLAASGMWLLLRPLIRRMVALEQEIRAKTAALERELHERKRMEKELQERRDANTKLAVIAKERGELQDWINTFDTFVGKFDPNGIGIIFNEAPLEAGGVTKDEVYGKYFPDAKWWSHSEKERARIVESFEKAKAGVSTRIETNFRSADGTPVPIIFNCQPVLDDDGKAKYITAEGKTIIEQTRLRAELQEAKEALKIRVKERTSELIESNKRLREEITEHKQAQDHIQHLQSVLKTIRNVHEFILRVKDQEKLVQGACEILSQTRDYKLVWIGLVEEGTKNVLPVAQAGFEEGYLRSIKITRNDSDTGKGPTGTAIRTGKPSVMQDIAGDPLYEPWRKEAMKRGYASSAAIPLVYGESVFGILNVYATILDAFDKEEIGLLFEIGRDIAFALHNIEIEEEIKRTKEFLQNVIDNTSDLVCTVDLEGNFLSINRAVTEHLGYEEEDLIGIPKRELAVDPEQFVNTFREVLEKGSLSNLEMPFRRKDGTIADFLYSVTLLRDKDGHPVAVAGFAKDITERKRAEEALHKAHEELEAKVAERTRELAQANIRLQELDRLKSMFIASMSHELRTPLNSIIGFTGIILQGLTGEINAEQRDQLQRVYGSAKHLLALINDVIDISKIEAGKFDVYTEKFSLNEAVREAVSNLTYEIANKGLGLEISLPQDLQLQTDRKRLLQCILNYLSNAVKFTEKGKIEIAVHEIDGMIEIRVKDTGIGIKEEDIPNLFTSFVRLDSPLKIKTVGTGLGLYLTKKIATELLNGSVSAESRYGEGSTFALKIPKALGKGDLAGCNGYLEKPIDPETVIAQIRQVTGDEP